MKTTNERKLELRWRCHFSDGSNRVMNEDEVWDELRQGNVDNPIISTEEVVVEENNNEVNFNAN